MSRQGVAQASRTVARAIIRNPHAARASFRAVLGASPGAALPPAAPRRRRPFSACARLGEGIMPETDRPAKETPEPESKYTVAELSEPEYHEMADEYLDTVLAKLEHLQDTTREDIDVEYSSGVMTVAVAGKGTYVINKQPPNKQIWLSSPMSGPKRYDWCIVSEEQGDKEGTGSGYWIYARDGSSLNEVIFKEIDVDIQSSVDS